MRGLLFLISSFLLASCAALPAIRPPADPAMMCPSPFLAEKTRLIHAIEVRAAGRAQTVVIGVTLADPASRTLSCAIVTPEGMVLLEASFGPAGMTVNRALPPFDGVDFARNMMDDIDLIFFAPGGALTQKGFSATGEAVCRRHKESGEWIDVLQDRDGRIRIQRYSKDNRLQRSVTLAKASQNPYSLIELQASEMINYTLMMTLMESEAVKDEIPRKN